MRDYNRQMEAAYLTSKRQGDMMRDRARERSTHEDRRNRYVTNETQDGAQRYVTGDNRGKGPRNYKRSDERIREIICDNLCDNPAIDASEIEVIVNDGEVILTGAVEDRRAKRYAEDISEDVSGVTQVENRLRIASRSQDHHALQSTRSNDREQAM